MQDGVVTTGVERQSVAALAGRGFTSRGRKNTEVEKEEVPAGRACKVRVVTKRVV